MYTYQVQHVPTHVYMIPSLLPSNPGFAALCEPEGPLIFVDGVTGSMIWGISLGFRVDG